jgi:hypothetical protein
VKARRATRHAASDWMEMEKERGISITSSVLQFEYEGLCVNLLDTPGHQDFSEDTYRALMAADSAITSHKSRRHSTRCRLASSASACARVPIEHSCASTITARS